MIEVADGIFYDPAKEFEEQTPEFQAYATEKYHEQVRQQVLSNGYENFDGNGDAIFYIDDNLIRAEVTRHQVKKYSKADVSFLSTTIKIFVK